MRISNIKTMWPEEKNFSLCHTDEFGDTVFIYFHTPVVLHAASGDIAVREGSAVLFDRFRTRSFTAVGNSLFLHDWMRIHEDLSDLMRVSGLKFETAYHVKNGLFITEIMQKIEIEHMNCQPYHAQISGALVKELLFKLAQTQQNAETACEIPPEMQSKLVQARSEIHKSYFENWTIQKMAELIPVSPAYFYTLYERAFGVPPKKDLQNIRIEHAKSLLEQQKYTVKEIAEQIGYENEYYFIRKFKELTGKTPGKYK